MQVSTTLGAQSHTRRAVNFRVLADDNFRVPVVANMGAFSMEK